MSQLLTLIYISIAVLFGFMFVWQVTQDRQKNLDWMTALQSIAIWSLSFLAGCMLIDSFKAPGSSTEHLGWLLRLVFLIFGIITTWGVFNLEWAVRDRFDPEKDGFDAELMFIGFVSCISVLLFSIAPTLVNKVPNAKMLQLLGDEHLWDAGFCVMLPFLMVKVGDWATQIPYRDVENRWSYPIEALNYEFWEWYDLMQINFEISQSLRTEYTLFQKPLKYLMNPWILAPKAQQVGDIFRVLVQERRKRRDIAMIQDVGTEYRGQAPFWMLFRVKRIWYRPNTWFRKIRFVNPNLSVIENELQQGDIIRIERMPHFAKTVPYFKPSKSSVSHNGSIDDTQFLNTKAQGNLLNGTPVQKFDNPYRDAAPNPMDAPPIEYQKYGYDAENHSELYPKLPVKPKADDKTTVLPQQDLNDAPTEMIRPVKPKDDDKTAILPKKRPNPSAYDDDKTTMLPKNRPNITIGDDDKTIILKK